MNKYKNYDDPKMKIENIEHSDKGVPLTATKCNHN